MLFQFVPPLSGTYQGDEYWYVAEQIAPASQTLGTVFQAGQPVATLRPVGHVHRDRLGLAEHEQRALAPQDANPAARAADPGR